MTDMLIKTTRVVARAALIAVNLLTIPSARADPEGLTRTDLQRHDLSASGHQVTQVRVGLARSGIGRAAKAWPAARHGLVVPKGRGFKPRNNFPLNRFQVLSD
jgi:hypothetical protein